MAKVNSVKTDLCICMLKLYINSDDSDRRAAKQKKPAVARVGRLYCLYPKASVRLLVAKRKLFPRVNTVPYTLRWRWYSERYNQL